MKNLVVITFLHFVSLFSFFLQLDNLSQQELASRLTLNCMNCYVEPQKLRDLDITVMDVRNLDQSRADTMFVDVRGTDKARLVAYWCLWNVAVPIQYFVYLERKALTFQGFKREYLLQFMLQSSDIRKSRCQWWQLFDFDVCCTVNQGEGQQQKNPHTIN